MGREEAWPQEQRAEDSAPMAVRPVARRTFAENRRRRPQGICAFFGMLRLNTSPLSLLPEANSQQQEILQLLERRGYKWYSFGARCGAISEVMWP